MPEITLALAAIAGVGSFFAPCILPVIPAFLAYISGTTVAELQKNQGLLNLNANKLNTILHSVFFVFGFSVVFSILGVTLNSILSGSSNIILMLNQVGGIIIIAFGLFMLFSTKFTKLNMEKKFLPKNTKVSYPMSFVFGLAFATGWTPCIGPVLGSILTLAATTPSEAFVLLLSYSAGLGIPFLLMGVFFSQMSRLTRLLAKHAKYYSVIMGLFIIILGILVLTNRLATIANFPFLNNLLLG